jgi:hypothetical protein
MKPKVSIYEASIPYEKLVDEPQAQLPDYYDNSRVAAGWKFFHEFHFGGLSATMDL